MSIFSKTNRVAGLALAFVILITGCSRTNTGSSPGPKGSSEKQPEKQLIIGLVPEEQVFAQLDKYKPIADYLSKKLGVKVKLQVFPQYEKLIDDFFSSDLDGAFFGSFTYVLAHAKLGVEAIARPVALDGTSSYSGLIFVRRDSGIRTAKDMEGKIFAFVNRTTTAGYLTPLVYFKKNHIKDCKTYFKEFYFTGTHEDAIKDVLNGKADIAAAKSTIFDKIARTDPMVRDTLLILDKSPAVPENALAVRKDLDSTLKEKIKAALLAMHTSEEGRNSLKDFQALRFIDTTDKDYEPVVRYAKSVGLNPAAVDYCYHR